MGVPIVYRKSSEKLASYDWFDSSAGAGYKTFYPIRATLSGSTVYWLTSKLADAEYNTNLAVTSGNTELNFDITFSNPVQVASADAYIEYTQALGTNSSGYIIFTIFHVDSAGTETSLGSTVTDTRSTGGSAETIRRVQKIALTKKSFAIGDKIRLSIDVYRTAGTITIYYDPNSRETFTESGSGATIGSSIKLNVPFRIDL